MKTKLILPLVVLLGGVLSFSLAAAPSTAGRVVYVDGEVTANGREAETGDLLSGTTTLKTGKASTVEVVFGERNVFRLGSDTVVRINFDQLQKTVNLDKGEFTSVLKKLARVAGAPSFVLKTPTVNAGVRGTSFHVSTDGTTTYFCTCNGSVTLDAQETERLELTKAHHGARIFSKSENGTVVTTAGLEGHTDASVESLAHRIGVTVDWSTPDLVH